MRLHTGVLAALVLALPGSVSAQASGSLPRVLELPASTRAMALGDAYMMNAGHSDAIFYHPALLNGADGFGLDYQRWGDESSATMMTAAVQWLGGGLGFGLQTLQYGAPGAGSLAAPAGQDHLFTLGATPVSERVAVVGYARELFGIDVGITTRLVDERVALLRQSTATVDVGAATDVGPLRVGLTVRDWGEDPIVTPTESTPRVVLGAGTYGRQVGALDVGVAAAANWSEDRTTISGGVEVGYYPIQGRTFIARLGVQDPPDGSDMSPLSMGFAFWADNIAFEWAFRPYSGPESSGSHRFGVRWR